MPRARKPESHPLDCGCAICAKVHHEAEDDRDAICAMLEARADMEDKGNWYGEECARRYRLASRIIRATSNYVLYKFAEVQP